MESKLFELQDSSTLIGVVALRYNATTEAEQRILDRAGLCDDSPYFIQLTILETCETKRDEFKWLEHSRTMRLAQRYIESRWAYLTSGQTINLQMFESRED